jgi:NADPH-dependent glutamate synthase beta subunit-like oxidoreductase/dihydroorotate dehydrogenase/NAD-dependent dihydropyrimidine dehydrogenase PreA subunit
VEIGGVRFRNPFIVASGPTTMSIEQLRAIQENGWAGASLKLMLYPTPYINRLPRYGWYHSEGYLAFTAEKRLTIDKLLPLIEQARKECPDLVIFSNITYVGEDIEGWIDVAKQCEDAGCHVNELNMGCPNMSFNVEMSGGGEPHEGPKSGASLGCNAPAAAAIVKAVKENTNIPVFLKLCPEGGQIRYVAKAAVDAGVDCVGSNANRLAIVPLDLDAPAKSTNFLQEEVGLSCMSGPWVLPLAKRDCYEIRRMVGPEPRVFACGGVTEARDAVEMGMCGADLVGICTATLTKGFGFMPEFIHDVKEYMRENGYETWMDLRDLVVRELKSAPEMTIYEGRAEIKDPGLSAPCVYACPAHVPAQGYVRAVADEEFEIAYRLVCSKNPFQSICGVICDHPCEQACTRAQKDEPLRIRDIKEFVLRYGREHGFEVAVDKAAPRPEKVAVVGAGPAGLSCAYDLARAGYSVDVFEKADRAGGALRWLIPRFRMGHEELDAEIESIRALGVNIRCGKTFGADLSLDSLKSDGYAATFLGIGAWTGAKPGIPGEDAEGCHVAIDFLRNLSDQSLSIAGESVGIIGGGFTAVDGARTCVRLGAQQVYILYRRTKDEMPATPEEVVEAEEEGVKVMYLVAPKEVLVKDGAVEGLRMVNHVLGESDSSGRRRPETVEGTEFALRLDRVIFAVSQKVRVEGDGALDRERSFIQVDPATGRTSVPGVYAGGDCIGGQMSVIQAVADGKRAAVGIDHDLAGDNATLQPEPELTEVDVDEVLLRNGDDPRRWRMPVSLRPANVRNKDWDPYRRPMTRAEAVEEAKRCYGCGCGAGCQLCMQLCNQFAYSLDENARMCLDHDKCVGCGMCVWRCPNQNIVMKQTSDEPTPSAGH